MPFSIECLDCRHRTPFSSMYTPCPACGSEWREARYDYNALGASLPSLASGRLFDMWRYLEVLPVRSYNPALSLGEGGTPLIHAENLGMMLGLPHLYIKDERQGPTHSFKDRQAAMGVAVLKEAGVTEAVLASTGNVAIAYSAYAVRAGIKLWAFLTSLVPAEKMREVAIYGTQVVKVTASYDQAKLLAAEFASQRGLFMEKGPRTIAALEGMKTIAFEVAEQLGRLLPGHPSSGMNGANAAPWRAPDWYFQAVSGGLGPLGVLKGFWELREMGLTTRIPALAGIQADGCAPMVHAWRQSLENAEPVRSPRTLITTLSTGDPGRTYTLLRQRMLESPNAVSGINAVGGINAGGGIKAGGGIFESVSDEEAYRAMHILAKMEGISMEPAAAVAFAGLIRLARAGKVRPEEVIVVNCTGHTVPVEHTILGEGWARQVTPELAAGETPEEGLLAALNHVTSDRYPRVLIADDTPDARRLIRRILQAQGDYTLFEAVDGPQAIELSRQERPDLLILDLMMPELDGFAVLDALKADPQTAPIPVIVVTAKELTGVEKARLRGQIHKVMQKGEFLSDDLADEVRALLT